MEMSRHSRNENAGGRLTSLVLADICTTFHGHPAKERMAGIDALRCCQLRRPTRRQPMRFSTLTTAVIVAYALGSLAYVYRWRGRTRYATLKQYLRKSWPVFAPLNCLLYMATHRWARRPALDSNYLKNISVLKDNWQTIRDEALALQSIDAFEAARVDA